MIDSDLAALAKMVDRIRKRRDRHFPQWLIGEPGFSILLDLYLAQCEEREITVSGVAFGAAVPLTTGLRWIEKLESAGLVVRYAHPQDSRLSMVRLSDDGLRRMNASLSDMRSWIIEWLGHAEAIDPVERADLPSFLDRFYAAPRQDEP